MPDLAAIFKAYDIRGAVPDQLDTPTAHAIGAAFATLDGDQAPPGTAVLVGHDMRASSPELAAAFAAGVRDTGRDVVSIGLCSTDELYFASGFLAAPAAMVTASHNPAGDNGFKLCRAGAVALSAATGLERIRDAVARGAGHPVADRRGELRNLDLLASYVDRLHSLAPVTGRHLTVVADAANGMAGLIAPAVFADLDVRLVPLYFELDGAFPNHPANPLVADNLRDLSAAVVAEGADLGLAFDGDADRCFVVDETGRPVSPSVVTSLIAIQELARRPGSTVIHNVITSRSVPETIRAHGGVPLRTPVGHSLIKAEMARTGAVFGGEHSGHYYFRDFWNADSGLLAALHVIAAVAESSRPVSHMAAELSPYIASGEVNLRVTEPDAVLAALVDVYEDRRDVEIDRLDGVTVTAPDWWLNVRCSNTEPLLRLNVEASDEQTMADVRDSTLAFLTADPLRRAT